MHSELRSAEKIDRSAVVWHASEALIAALVKLISCRSNRIEMPELRLDHILTRVLLTFQVILRQ